MAFPGAGVKTFQLLPHMSLTVALRDAVILIGRRLDRSGTGFNRAIVDRVNVVDPHNQRRRGGRKLRVRFGELDHGVADLHFGMHDGVRAGPLDAKTFLGLERRLHEIDQLRSSGNNQVRSDAVESLANRIDRLSCRRCRHRCSPFQIRPKVCLETRARKVAQVLRNGGERRQLLVTASAENRVNDRVELFARVLSSHFVHLTCGTASHSPSDSIGRAML